MIALGILVWSVLGLDTAVALPVMTTSRVVTQGGLSMKKSDGTQNDHIVLQEWLFRPQMNLYRKPVPGHKPQGELKAGIDGQQGDSGGLDHQHRQLLQDDEHRKTLKRRATPKDAALILKIRYYAYRDEYLGSVNKAKKALLDAGGGTPEERERYRVLRQAHKEFVRMRNRQIRASRATAPANSDETGQGTPKERKFSMKPPRVREWFDALRNRLSPGSQGNDPPERGSTDDNNDDATGQSPPPPPPPQPGQTDVNNDQTNSNDDGNDNPNRFSVAVESPASSSVPDTFTSRMNDGLQTTGKRLARIGQAANLVMARPGMTAGGLRMVLP